MRPQDSVPTEKGGQFGASSRCPFVSANQSNLTSCGEDRPTCVDGFHNELQMTFCVAENAGSAE